MARDYNHLDRYLNKLSGQIYPQPEDRGHTIMATEVISRWMTRLPDCRTVLDVGCGTGFCQSMFERFGVEYTGIGLGEDVLIAQEAGRNVHEMDFSFLDFLDNSYDLVASRHSLEHSPMPLLTLMEWYRVSKQWLGLVLPAPEHYGVSGRNHYYVLDQNQWKNLLSCSGWSPIWEEVKLGVDGVPWEYWIFCEKVK